MSKIQAVGVRKAGVGPMAVAWRLVKLGKSLAPRGGPAVGFRAHGSMLLLVALAVAGCQDTPSEPTNTVTSVTVSAAINNIVITGTVQLQAHVNPDGAPQTVTWQSGDTDIASVSSSGLVTGVRTGSVTITATSTADASKTGSIVISVECPDPRLVTADISANTTWENWLLDPVCFDYVVTVDLDFNSGVLTIEPGAVVGFEEGRRVAVKGDGGLNAAGLANNPIRLTGTEQTRGFWQGILFQNTDNPANVLQYTTIEQAGPAPYGGGVQAAGLMIDGTSVVRLENSTVKESSTYGIFLRASAEITGSGGNTFTSNALGPAYAYASVTHYLTAGSADLLGNDIDEVTVRPDEIDESQSVTWGGLVDPQTGEVAGRYRIMQITQRDAFAVRGTLTLLPGVTIAFEQDMAMVVRSGGGLSAVGTANLPIELTGTEQVPGHWRGLAFTDTDNPMNRLEFVDIAWGGRESIGSGEPANLVITDNSSVKSRVTVMNSTLHLSEGYGMYVRSLSTLDNFTGNTLSSNLLGPAYVGTKVVAQLGDSNNMTGNALDFVTVLAGGGINSLTEDVTWVDVGVPLRLVTTGANELSLEGADLVLKPGVEIRFADDMGFQVKNGAYLGVAGTAEDRVVFRAHGSQWRGIHVHDAEAYFDFADIDDGGSSIWSGAAKAGAVTMTSSSAPAKAKFTPNVTSSGAPYGIVFTLGDTFGSGCLSPTYIPPPDMYVDHCNPNGDVRPPAPPPGDDH